MKEGFNPVEPGVMDRYNFDPKAPQKEAEGPTKEPSVEAFPGGRRYDLEPVTAPAFGEEGVGTVPTVGV